MRDFRAQSIARLSTIIRLHIQRVLACTQFQRGIAIQLRAASSGMKDAKNSDWESEGVI